MVLISNSKKTKCTAYRSKSNFNSVLVKNRLTKKVLQNLLRLFISPVCDSNVRDAKRAWYCRHSFNRSSSRQNSICETNVFLCLVVRFCSWVEFIDMSFFMSCYIHKGISEEYSGKYILSLLSKCRSSSNLFNICNRVLLNSPRFHIPRAIKKIC